MGKDCRKCKSYKDCPGKEWFHYGEVRWCPWQVLWLIKHSVTLLDGRWPPDPEGSGYIDPGIKTGYASEGYYVKPVGILAEVEYRRRRTGTDGKLLRAEVLAKLELSREAKDALMYIKGWRRKRMSYTDWKKLRRYRNAKAILSR